MPEPSLPTLGRPGHGSLDLHLPRIWIQPHYASFNGLRALAISLVFLVHYGAYILPESWVSQMWMGVDLFFVLSGFLITGILYDSMQDPRFFRNFYVRRALRIFPLFYGFFLALFLLTPLLHISYRRSILFYVFYLGNLVMPYFDLARDNPTIIVVPFHHHSLNLNIGSFWTLCVEEQFYLLWPAVVWLVRLRTRLMQVCIWGSFAILLIRLIIFLHPGRLMPFMGWYTYTRADTLLVGAWFALWLRGRPLSRGQLRRLSAALFWGSVAAFVLACETLTGRSLDLFGTTVGYTLIALGSGGLLLRSLDETGHFARFLQLRRIASFGAISYGFYFVHALYLYEVRDLYRHHVLVHRFGFLIPFVVFGISFLLAKLSFRFLEEPFLRLKRKLAPQWVPWTEGASMKGSATLVKGSAALHVSEPR